MVLEADKADDQRRKLTVELEKMGIRLNRKKPDVTITPNKSGMYNIIIIRVRITSTIKLTKVDEKLIKNILQEYKLHNVDVLIREDITVDDLIDMIEGNRKYVRCLYVFNKIDKISVEEVDEIARRKDHCVISCNLKLNLDYLLECMWDKLDLVRVYTKKRG
jgi:ribosome-interacting GTPase 1